MSAYQLSNVHLNVVITPKGAELQSIYNKHTSIEYMWNGNPVYWGKKSPVLFPIVGGLKNNTYLYKGKSYLLSRHGFARDTLFTVTEQTENSITFSISSNEQTLLVYPFHFLFSVVYQLTGNTLQVRYVVKNTGKEEMFFSVGAHPAFAVPLVEETGFADYYLLFNQAETTGRWPLSKDGLIERHPVSLLNHSDKLPLSKELFYGDALVCKQLQSNTISLMSDKTANGLKVQFDGFPYMGIWNAKDANFICIEPWCGIADSIDTNQDITQKEGIRQLMQDEIFEKMWSVEVF